VDDQQTQPVEPSTHPVRLRSFWVAQLALVGLVLGVIGLAFAFDNWAPEGLASRATLVVGVVLVLVPAAVWLIAFYRMDRTEPEPKHLVGASLVLAGLLAAGVGEPFIRFMDPHRWSTRSTWAALAASLLVVAAVQEYIKYLAVRFAVVPTGEIDQRIDGIIYGTAAGLGYASVLNLGTVLDLGGAGFGPASVSMAVIALAHAGFGGLLGYFLAVDLLDVRPWWWLPAGYLGAVAANGTFFFLRSFLTGAITGPGVNPAPARWLGLLFAALVALAISASLATVMHRAERVPAQQEAGR